MIRIGIKKGFLGLLFLCGMVLLSIPARGGDPTATPPPGGMSVPDPSGKPEPVTSAPTEAKEARLEVAWDNKRLTIDAVDTDVQAILKAISEKSGVEIQVSVGVTGKVSLREEKVPIEKAVDDLLAAVGQRNYLMVFDGGELTKMSIVPKGAGGAGLSDAAKRVKVKGKLRNGKEIEYYPGEIWIGLGGYPRTEAYLNDFIRGKETKHGLSFLKSVRVDGDTMMKFRILDGRDVIAVMQEVGGFATPNGLGPRSIEMPEEDFHVIDESVTDEELVALRKNKNLYPGFLRKKNPFMKKGDILKNGLNIPYKEGELTILVMGSDPTWITFDDVMGLIHDEGGILFSSHSSAGGNSFLALFFDMHTPEEHADKISRLKSNELFKRAKIKGTGPAPVYWGSADAVPDDDRYDEQWHLTKIRAEQAWDSECGSKYVTVGVIDSGIAAGHGDLGGQVNDRSADFSLTPYAIRGDAMDDDDVRFYHGTHVSGICAALTNNGIGIAGVAGGGWSWKTGASVLSLQVNHGQEKQVEDSLYYSLGLAGGVDLFPGIPFEQVEAGVRGWSADPPWGISDDKYYGGQYSWTDSPSGGYDNNADASLTSAVVDLGGYGDRELRLSFWALTALAAGDSLFVEASKDGGLNWVQIATLAGQSDWSLRHYDIPATLRTGQFKFRFRLKTDAAGTDDGVYIDDIGIGYPLAQVLNLSWNWMYRTDRIRAAIEKAYDEGVVVVGAADNEDKLVDISGLFTQQFLEKILVVGATDEADKRWDDCPGEDADQCGSSYGAHVDVSAPGARILSTVGSGDGYSTQSGTSMATPQVAGLAALLLLKNPSMTNAQVYERIKITADPISESGMGTGRVNLYGALRGARDSGAPARPTDTVLIPGPREIRMTWSATDSEDAIGECFVYRRLATGVDCASPETIAGTPYCQVAMVGPSQPNGTAFEYTDATVTESDLYYYRIVAVDKTGNKSLPSDEVGPAQHTLAPAKPTELEGRAGNGTARFTWTAPTTNADGSEPLNDLAGYYVSYGQLNDATPMETPLTTETACDLSLENDKEYYVTVVAVDEVGNRSAYADWVTVKPIDAIWVHKQGGPLGAETSIGTAMAAASSGSTIMVGPDTYPQTTPIVMKSGVKLRSERGPGMTVIEREGGGAGAIISAAHHSRIIGFTIKSYDSFRSGRRGISCTTLGNIDVLISNNIFIGDGGTIDAEGRGVYVQLANDPEIRIFNNVFTNNYYGIHGYGLNAPLMIHNNAFKDNPNAQAAPTSIFLNYGSVPSVVDYNILPEADGFGGNNHDWDPGFVLYDSSQPEYGDYHLLPESQARDAGKSDLVFEGTPWLDPDESLVDIGAYGGPYAVIDEQPAARFLLPIANDLIAYATRNGIDHPIALSAYDPLGGSLSYSVIDPPDFGTLSGTGAYLVYTPLPGYTGTDSFTFKVSSGSRQSNIARVDIVVANNQPPLLDPLSDVALDEDSTLRTVYLRGISAGANENQPVTVTATSSNPGLIPNPTVSYTSPGATGSLSFTPVADAYGSATITVTVNDGQTENNTVVRSLLVTVTAVNDAPTLDAIPDMTMYENAGAQIVSLSGIAPGPGESETLTVTATSSNPGLIPNPTVSYASPSATGSLSFTPMADTCGSATLTVTADDGQGPNNTAVRAFTVTVEMITVPGPPTIGSVIPGDGQATVSFAAPSSNGGSAIGGYTVTSNPGGLMGTGVGSPITVFGLTNGVTYDFTVTATNAVGTGPASDPSASVTPGLYFDILWQESTNGWLYLWNMAGASQIDGAFLDPNQVTTNWKTAGIADFDEDGRQDILWQDTADGWLYVWYMDGLQKIGGTFLTPNQVTTNWMIAGVADFDGDGKQDILWQDTAAGSLYIWYMGGGDGATQLSGAFLTPNQIATNWKIVGVADFDGDGRQDILWQDAAAGWLYIWYMGGGDGATQLSGTFLTPSQATGSWKIRAVRDIDGDGKADLLWRDESGYLYRWFMGGADGSVLQSGGFLNPNQVSPEWEMSGAGQMP